MNHPALFHPSSRQAGALVIWLSTLTCAGCTNQLALGGWPPGDRVEARQTCSTTGSYGGSGPPVITGGAPELLATVCFWGAIGAAALVAEGLRRLFGHS